MASEFETLIVVFSPTAEDELWEVWKYNAESYSPEHADEYQEFLLTGINKLPENQRLGKRVSAWPKLQYITLRRRSRGEGHCVVYETALDAGTISIHHIFHTRMDVMTRLQHESDPD